MNKLKDFIIKNEIKLVLIVGFLLVSLISFQTGYLEGKKVQSKSIVIEKPTENINNNDRTVCGASQAQNLTSETKKDQSGTNTPSQNCPFVGSKNSNKYHLPTCRWAKNIKPENLICFSSEDEAKSKGYLPDKNCIK